MQFNAPDSSAIRGIVAQALHEDHRMVDITSHALIDEDVQASAHIFVKEEGVLCGIFVAEEVFRSVNLSLKLQRLKEDGDAIKTGDWVLKIDGCGRDILTAERVALNFVQRLSGIATQTARYVKAAGDTKILDTRKTTPGLRVLEKYAVRCGGGVNHRMGLYDEFLVKDNHIALMKGRGGIREAVQRARVFNPKAKLTVEAETLDHVQELVDLRVDQILLDNMSTAQIAEAVRMVDRRCKMEASGGMTLERIPEIAETGVDFISVGALTHHIRALDFSLEIE